MSTPRRPARQATPPPAPLITPSLTAQILEILFRTPAIHRPWKDVLSDRILDAHQSGHPLTPQDLLEHLHSHQPQVFDRLTCHPLVRHEILALGASTSHTPSDESL